MHLKRGLGIIEIIVAIGLFIIIATAGLTVVIGSFNVNRLGEEYGKALLFAGEGLDAARSIRNSGWTTPFLNTNCVSGCGVSASGGSWVWSGATNTLGKYTRVVTVSSVVRNGLGNIVSGTGTSDSEIKKVTSTVTWYFSPLRQITINLSTYLSYFKKPIAGNWANPNTLAGSLDLSGGQDGLKIMMSGQYAYIVRNGGTPNFAIVNISNAASPSLTGSLTLTGVPRNIFVLGDYAYISSDNNSQELQIVNISNPANPNLVGSYNASGNGNGNAVYVSGSTAYLGRVNGGAAGDFLVINVSNPASPTLVGSLNTAGNTNDITVSGSYAYVASSDNAQELKVISLSNPASPTVIGSYNAPGNTDAVSIDGSGNLMLIGQGTNMYTINVANPASPSLSGSYAAGGTVNDIDFDTDSLYAFLATTNGSNELQVINITTPTSPTLVGGFNSAAAYNGVSYSLSFDRAYMTGSGDAQELSIIQP